MRNFLLLTLLVGSCAITEAQPAPSCPLEFGRMYIKSCKGCNPDPALHVEVRNLSSKKITGTEYGNEFEDAVGTKRELPRSMVSGYFIMPGKLSKQDWDMRGWGGPIEGVTLWLKKVRFEDGTTWETEDRACGAHTEPVKGR